MPGQLFRRHFLTDGIRAPSEWRASIDQPEAFAWFGGQRPSQLPCIEQIPGTQQSRNRKRVDPPGLGTPGERMGTSLN